MAPAHKTAELLFTAEEKTFSEITATLFAINLNFPFLKYNYSSDL